MFGYLTINKDELKIKDYRKYNSFYCGVCRSLNRKYGLSGRLTLTYDMTFIAVLLSGLYEDSTVPVRKHCIAHPVKKHEEICNTYTDYAAAMNVMLAYYKLKDNWQDEKSLISNAGAGLLSRGFKKAKKEYPKQAEAIRQYIEEQHACEAAMEQDIDIVSGCTGRMLGKILDIYSDEWSKYLYDMGFFLGKYIYIMDAYDDIEEDIKKNNYNPFLAKAGEPDFREYCRSILCINAAEAAKAFEYMPILENVEIIRNIIYAGIWTRFNKKRL